jgi:hypothetical protein
MALIKIFDLNHPNRISNSDLIELHSDELKSIRGGWRNRRAAQTAAHNLMTAVFDRFSFSGGENTSSSGNSFQILIDDFSGGDRVSYKIDGSKLGENGNFFYTSSGIAPIGGVAISGYPGAYTF